MLRNKPVDTITITLRSARVNAGLTQKEAAEMLGVDTKTLLTKEKDSSNLSFDLLEKMSDLYEIPINFFFLGVESHLLETKKNHRKQQKGA